MALTVDKDGTAYCGLQTFLEKGLDGFVFPLKINYLSDAYL